MTVFLALIGILLTLGTTTAAERIRYITGRQPDVQAMKVFVCHGFGCRLTTPVVFSHADMKKIAGRLGGARDAAAERAALVRAVSAYEAIVGRRAGTSSDLPGIKGWGRDDQMDCIDEATNTSSLLILLSEHGYLRHHTVRSPTSRGFFLDGRYPHATAVIAEKGGEQWSVDSWPRANGEAPVIMPMRDWWRQRTSSLPS